METWKIIEIFGKYLEQSQPARYHNITLASITILSSQSWASHDLAWSSPGSLTVPGSKDSQVSRPQELSLFLSEPARPTVVLLYSKGSIVFFKKTRSFSVDVGGDSTINKVKFVPHNLLQQGTSCTNHPYGGRMVAWNSINISRLSPLGYFNNK